jgi:spore coat polysaccharide biosynthesis protein SpsF
MKTAVIVQARVGSSRLRGKVLMDIGGRTVIEEVLRRCRAIPGADVVVCAIPTQSEDDELVTLVQRTGVVIVRGSAKDVLSRYRLASEHVGADIVMRITSDCPLIAPTVCGAVLQRRAEVGADYASNNIPASFPHGLDCEAFTADALRLADRSTDDPYDREHVTSWLQRAPGIRRAELRGPGGRALHHRWTLDYPADYEFFRAVFSLLPPPPAIPVWSEVEELLAAHPEIMAINRLHHGAKV